MNFEDISNYLKKQGSDKEIEKFLSDGNYPQNTYYSMKVK
jgi:hypothetical protein